ncbi:DUF1127 domain-containing protein [Falsiroseomonas sp. HW251]|uniref:DUF1127 domain-containing protein n=1 Tax=Falsiroseomonas sp. HW251 TaxID=3390998 RepID=UPI003D310EA0
MTRIRKTEPRTDLLLRFGHLVGEWRARSRDRALLASLGHRELRDIGLSPGEAAMEASKPFWMV